MKKFPIRFGNFFIVFLIVKFESDNFGYDTDFLGRYGVKNTAEKMQFLKKSSEKNKKSF